MEFIKKYGLSIIVILMIITATAIRFSSSGDSSSSTEEKPGDSSKTDQSKTEDSAKTVDKSTDTQDFKYTAVSGDSWTTLARKSIQKFAKDSGKSLSPAQIIAAETFLTQNAGEPDLDIGQKVTIPSGDVSKVVDQALGLSSSDLAAWEVYVPYVDFS